MKSWDREIFYDSCQSLHLSDYYLNVFNDLIDSVYSLLTLCAVMHFIYILNNYIIKSRIQFWKAKSYKGCSVHFWTKILVSEELLVYKQYLSLIIRYIILTKNCVQTLIASILLFAKCPKKRIFNEVLPVYE